MTKSQLVRSLIEREEIKKIKAETIVNTIFDSLSEALIKGQRIEIRGFGSFVNRKYEPYHGRNPRTKEVIYVPSKRLPFFKIGKEFKKRLNSD